MSIDIKDVVREITVDPKKATHRGAERQRTEPLRSIKPAPPVQGAGVRLTRFSD